MAAIEADPYAWPFDSDLTPLNMALIVIGMQPAMTCRPTGSGQRAGPTSGAGSVKARVNFNLD